MKELKKKRLKQLALWTMAWLLTVMLTKYGATHMWEGNTLISLVAILLNLGAGLGMILINRKLVNESDELEKKIQLEAMGITLGLTLIVGLTISLLDYTHLIDFHTEISTLITFMGLTYLASMIFNNVKYR